MIMKYLKSLTLIIIIANVSSCSGDIDAALNVKIEKETRGEVQKEGDSFLAENKKRPKVKVQVGFGVF